MRLGGIGLRDFTIGLIIISLTVLVGAVVLSIYTAIPFVAWVSAAGTIGTILLSGLLVYIYYQISNIQEGQFEAQKHQTKLMLNSQKPVLRIESLKIEKGIEIAKEVFEDSDLSERSQFYENNTGFLFRISNPGDGPAHNISLEVECYISNFDDGSGFQPLSDYGYEFISQELARVDGSRVSSAQPLMGERGETLQKGETDEFVAFASLTNIADFDIEKPWSAIPTPVSEFASKLDNEQFVCLQIKLEYEYAGSFTGEDILYRVMTKGDEFAEIENIEDYGRPLPDIMLETANIEL